MKAAQLAEIIDKASGKKYTLRGFVASQSRKINTEYIKKAELLKSGILTKDELDHYEKNGKLVPLVKSKRKTYYKRSEVMDYIAYKKMQLRWVK